MSLIIELEALGGIDANDKVRYRADMGGVHRGCLDDHEHEPPIGIALEDAEGGEKIYVSLVPEWNQDGTQWGGWK